MARTIEEIKKDMTTEWMKQPAVMSAYGLDGKKAFKDCFSAASLENILFYVFAFAVWSLESLFDLHRDEVDLLIERFEPHTLRWYVAKAKNYMQGYSLVTDCDYYDTSKLSASEIEAARVVKYAVATEKNTVVYIKVARQGEDGNPQSLTAGQLAGLRSYLEEIKDAGVSIQVRNEPADSMQISLVIYYDPTLLTISSNGTGVLPDGSEPVRETVKSVITGLPFNGVFRKSDLMAALQDLPCVKVADITSVKVKAKNAVTGPVEVVGYSVPESGYYEITSLDVDYKPYNTVG